MKPRAGGDVAGPARAPAADPLAEAHALVAAAGEAGLTLRVIGGVGIVALCPSASSEPLRRPYKDLDLAALSKERKPLQRFLVEQGYVAAERFNLLHGESQLMFGDTVNVRQVDVFLDTLKMCHELRFADRLDRHPLTLDPADLLLTKLQVVKTTERDLRDILAILVDCDIDLERVGAIVGNDWGWWRTVTEVLSKAEHYAAQLTGWQDAERFAARLALLRRAIHDVPKSLRWRTRARVGERKRWYELPEDTRADD